MTLRPRSLRTRLLVAASLVLTASLIVTGLALESAFRDSARQAQKDKLEGIIYSLLSAAGPSASGELTISASGIETRLKSASSSMQAALVQRAGCGRVALGGIR